MGARGVDGDSAALGATGRQGGAVARHLPAAGRPVLALTRDPESLATRALRSAGASVARCEMDDAESLHRVFAGAHGVYSVQNPMIAGGELFRARAVRDKDAELELEAEAGVGVVQVEVADLDGSA
ncbi:NmrA family NAD(P)-binding protein [Kribbella sp. NPDC004138]